MLGVVLSLTVHRLLSSIKEEINPGEATIEGTP